MLACFPAELEQMAWDLLAAHRRQRNHRLLIDQLCSGQCTEPTHSGQLQHISKRIWYRVGWRHPADWGLSYPDVTADCSIYHMAGRGYRYHNSSYSSGSNVVGWGAGSREVESWSTLPTFLL
jgi:hypothetical protein